jgi:cell wall-associated NlpC family hydrolase
VENPLAWTYADCSSFATSCYRRAGERDPNRDRYRAGWTGTLSRHGWRVRKPEPGDLVFYGVGWPWKHVTVYLGAGRVASHGSEGGPRDAAIDYRPDRGEVRRYIAPAPLRPYYAVRVWAGRLLRA